MRPPTRPVNQPEGSFSRVNLMMGSLMTAIFCFVGYSLYSGNKALQTYAPLVDAAMEIKLEATIGHLWFEEVLSGDRQEDIDRVWQHLEQSSWYANSMLKGGTNAEGTFIRLVDPELRRQIENVTNKLSHFRSMAEQRYAARELSAAGTDIDEQFDAVFRDFMAEVDSVETVLQMLMNRERTRFISIQSVLAILCLVIAALVVFVLRRERANLVSTLQEVKTLNTDHLQALDKLRKSEERMRLFFERQITGMAITSPEKGWLQVNEPLCEMLGYTREELDHLTWSELTHPDDLAADEFQYNRMLAGEIDGYVLDKRFLRKDGELVYASLSVGCVRLPDGDVEYVLAALLDITDRKRAETGLRQSEAVIRNKLKAIVEPDGDLGALELSDIINTELLQSMLEDFHRLTGMLGAVLDLSGNVLIAVGWQDICTKFHRCNPESLKNCIESDTILTDGIPEGTFKAYRCKNNMWDMVTPLFVGGRHVGNVFIGQFFYEDEVPDVELFRKQARLYGFDEREYLEALDRVPRFSRETAEAGMMFYTKLARVVSTLSFNALKQSRMLVKQAQVEAVLRESEDRYRRAQTISHVGSWEYDLQTSLFSASNEAKRIYGFDLEDADFSADEVEKCIPERERVHQALIDLVEKNKPYNLEFDIHPKNGSKPKFIASIAELKRDEHGAPQKIVGVIQDITERKRSEEALRESEARALLMADLVMNSNQPVGIGFLDGRLGRLNPAFCDLTGYTEKELQAIDWATELTPPEWLPAEREALVELERTGEPVRYEKEYIHKNGTRIPIELFAHLARDADGNPDYYYAFITDITERKQAEEELRRRASQLKASQETARLGNWELDLSTGQITWSDELYRIFGMKPGEVQLTYESLLERVHPEDRAYQDQVTEQIATQGSARFEYRVVLPNGDIRWISGQGETTLDETGKPVRIFGIAQDITERKQEEEALRRESSMLQLALEASHTGAWYLNLTDHTSHRTLGHDQIFGYRDPVADWTYELFLEHVHPEDREEVDRKFQEATASETDWNFECRIRRPDGELRWIWAVGRPDMIRDTETPIMGGVVQDITERRRAAEELQTSHDLLEQRVEERTLELKARKEEAETLSRAMINLLQDLKETNLGLETTKEALRITNSELEAFSYSVSHDLRAPLRHIDGFVKLLLKREKEQLDAISARYLDTIAQSSGRMGRLIDDLLAFSRTGRAEMHRNAVDSNEVIQEIVEEMSPTTEGRHLVWAIGDLPVVQADGNLLRQVWQNLIGNAIKYTAPREEARIEIGIMPESGEEGMDGPVFFIRDNGVGFDPQYTHKLFGVFQRLHRDDEFEGTGIGLATVRRIVHRHGGRVWAEGKIDDGAAFYFTLQNE